ncbi:MAG: PIN domain-containing protein [Candidatus Aminicenantes bacterium]|nr:PIN domain-containing protein [Candidatus Aminicenantes bacterium]
MFVVDTNILVYAADEDSNLHKRCSKLIEEWRKQSTVWYVTWGILYEFLRVITHPRVFRKPWSITEAWKFVEAILASPSLGILIAAERHADVAAEVIKSLPLLSGNLLYDAQTAILMREHGIERIYTRDMDFHRFPFLEPVDPTT